MEVENNNSQPVLDKSQTEASTKIPWRKVALLGALTQVALGLLWGLVLNAGFGFLLSATLVFKGTESLQIIFYVLAVPVVYRYLKRWALGSPLLVASSSVAFLYGAYRFSQKVPLPSKLESSLAGYTQTSFQELATNPVIVLALFVAAGVLIFLLTVFVTNKLRYKPLAVVLLVAITIVPYAATYAYNPTSLLTGMPKVKDVEWRLLPTYLMPGTADKGLPGGTNCANENTKAYWYECDYDFENYPGYLSANTRSIIDSAVTESSNSSLPDFHFQPADFLTIRVIKENNALNAYKYKDGKCDIQGLIQAGTSLRNQDGSIASRTSPNPKLCGKVTTPGGKDLYYDSYLNYSKDDFTQVPVDFYFEQAGDIITVRVGNERPLAGKVRSLYYTDPNFQPEFYKFVDSFSR